MALVLSNQENIDLLLFWLKLAVGICCIAIATLVAFWLRLKNLERQISTPTKNSKLSPKHLSRPSQRLLKIPHPKSSRHYRSRHKRLFANSRSLWRWLLAIATIVSITITLSNGFVGSEITTFLWLLIGVMLVAVAAFEI